MQLNFESDLLKIIQDKLIKLGVSPISLELETNALLLFKLERRSPEAKPRSVKISDVFSIPEELQQGFEKLCEAITQGQPLLPYLSRSTLNPLRKDGLLDDWGILHFHLGSELKPDGLIERTKKVAFGLVRDEAVYFIQAYDHGPGHRHVWVEEDLLNLLHKNWPNLLTSNGVNLTGDSFTQEERTNLRIKNTNTTFTLPNDEVIFAPGGGMMSNGTSMMDLNRLQFLLTQLDYLKRLCLIEESAIRHAIGVNDKEMEIQVGLQGKSLYLYESTTGREIRFHNPQELV